MDIYGLSTDIHGYSMDIHTCPVLQDPAFTLAADGLQMVFADGFCRWFADGLQMVVAPFRTLYIFVECKFIHLNLCMFVCLVICVFVRFSFGRIWSYLVLSALSGEAYLLPLLIIICSLLSKHIIASQKKQGWRQRVR